MKLNLVTPKKTITVTFNGLCYHLMGQFEQQEWAAGDKLPVAECHACNKRWEFDPGSGIFKEIQVKKL